MNYKKTLLTAFAFVALLSSCGENGKKAETTEAKTVETVETASTNSFSKIQEGSNIEWRASHLAGAQPRFGKIFLKNARLSVTDGKLTNAEVVVDMNSLTVENFPEGSEQKGKLTNHLKQEDFFNVAKFPYAKFELTSVVKTTGEYNSKVQGNLTILDQTKSIIFSANISVTNKEVSIKSEDFSVNRQDWGLTYHSEGTEGVPVDYLIADDIGFTINVTTTK